MRLEVEIANLPQVSKDVESVVAKFVADATSTLTNNLRSRTPIDTGRARRGWTSRTQRLSSTIENTVPYIEYLEKGHSRQAPTGFVQQAVKATVAEMNRKGKL